jgi:hypothetical protein
MPFFIFYHSVIFIMTLEYAKYTRFFTHLLFLLTDKKTNTIF